MTGLATGPHLHYEYLTNGVHRNPQTVQLPGAEPLRAQDLQRFRELSAPLLADLAPPQPPAAVASAAPAAGSASTSTAAGTTPNATTLTDTAPTGTAPTGTAPTGATPTGNAAAGSGNASLNSGSAPSKASVN
jgi:hypothetical protein